MDDPEDEPDQSVKSAPELYTSVKALADALHVSRQTVHNWFKLPDCPAKRPDGQLDATAWRTFARSIGTKTNAGQSDDKSSLQEEELRLKNEQRRKKIEREDCLWTRNEQIDRDILARVQEAVSVLRSKFERELPPLYTADAHHNGTLNEEAIDEVCERLSRPLPCQEDAPRA